MKGGNEPIPCFVGYMLAGLLKGITGSPSFPRMVAPDVTCLMGVIVSILQLTAGMGRTVNQLSTMDTL